MSIPLDRGKAHHDQMRGHLVEHYGVLPQPCGPLAVWGRSFLVPDDYVSHTENRVVQNREELVVGIAQLLAAQTNGVPVHHVCGGEIGHHPTVAHHGFYHEDGVTAQLYGHEAVEIEPAEKVVKGVPEAAPFAGAESTVIGRRRTGPIPCRFWGYMPCYFSSFRAARSFFISILSTKACTLVRSWPLCPTI